MKSLSVSHACGRFEFSSFHLRITRPGCEYDGGVERYSKQIDPLLPSWFEHAAVSGYGDMQSLETKVDSEVRNAREIPASEFEVKPEFLGQIQKLWGNHFLPRNVRAEPYKIHLYGPGGHFKSHRDTPETGLVGTFLVGLGDTSSTSAGHFRIGDKTLRAERCSWVAFHPDIPHEITKLVDGYRAVVAFKIFRMADDEPDVLPALEARVKRILDQIPVPFGLFTTHQYSIGTTSLNGFDALLLAYARSRNDTKAHMLPVVTEFYGEAFDDDLDPREYENQATSYVYPFTQAHVDILLKKNVARAKKEVRWLRGLSETPFYTWNIRASLEAWKEDHPNGSGYIGNEADSSREDSIYLSYAILFLPSPTGSQATEVESEEDGFESEEDSSESEEDSSELEEDGSEPKEDDSEPR